MAAVEGRHVAPAQRLHHAAQRRGCRRAQQQLHLVVEQRVGMQLYRVHTRRLVQRRQVGTTVVIVDEHRLRVMALLQQMVRKAGSDESGQTGHGSA